MSTQASQLTRIDPADPLTLTSTISVVTDDGLTLIADDWRSIDIDNHDDADHYEVAASIDGHPVVIRRHVIGRTHYVVGSDRIFSPRWLASGDNARLLTRIELGRDDLAYALGLVDQRPAEHRPTTGAAHRAIPTRSVAWSTEVVAATPGPDVDVTSPAFSRAAGHAGRLLDAETFAALVDFADDTVSIDSPGALVLRGVAIGEVGPTPETPTSATDKDHVSEFSLLTVARILGQPVGYIAEHGGNVVQNISPTPTDAARQTSTSSAVTLEFHTETAFHRHRSRYLLLLCLRGNSSAATTLCCIDDVIGHLSLQVRQILHEPRFRTRVDESFGGGSATTFGANVPVLSGSWEHPDMVFDAELMSGIDGDAGEALEALRVAVRTHHTGITLEPGDLLIVDNSRCVHGRSPFTPRYDGTDRWLQRTFVVNELASSVNDRDGRVIATRFAP